MVATIRRFGLPPRFDFFRCDTPVQPLHRVSEELFPGENKSIWIKRDDESGGVISGNKIRKLAYVLAQAIADKHGDPARPTFNCDTVLTAGRAQSNHCRATCIAARQLGLEVELFLALPQPATPRGNLFLDELCGAKIHWIDESTYKKLEPRFAARTQELKAQGRSALIIPMGASNAVGTLGYVECGFEIEAAQHEHQAGWDAVICTLGSGGTSAGLELGLRLAGSDLPLYSINICDSAPYFRPIIADLAQNCAQQFNLSATVAPEEIKILGGHEGSAEISAETKTCIRQFAQREGIVLDPTYTGKAMAALIQEMKTGRLKSVQRPLFIHTGGVYGLLGRSAEF